MVKPVESAITLSNVYIQNMYMSVSQCYRVRVAVFNLCKLAMIKEFPNRLSLWILAFATSGAMRHLHQSGVCFETLQGGALVE